MVEKFKIKVNLFIIDMHVTVKKINE